MRIISKFHDFYDSVQVYGQDRSLIYQRKRQEFFLPSHNPTESSKIKLLFPKTGNIRAFNFVIIGFCDNFHLAFSEDWRGKRDQVWYHTIDEYEEYIKTKDKKTIKDYYYKGTHKKCRPFCWNDQHFTQDGLNELFKRFKEEKKDHHDLFEQYKCPILTIEHQDREVKLTINPCLKDYSFSRIKDPFQAFQELSQYLGNQASPEKELPKLDDLTMSEIKGFDKFSFRKDKKCLD